MSEKQDELQPIIVKKVKKGGGGHHGGAWKVAYADFVTAMMAFFLLLWLLNVSTEEQKMGIADYFDPNPRISDAMDGAGGVMGGLTISEQGARVSDVQPVEAQQSLETPSLRPGETPNADQEETIDQVDPEALAAQQERAQEQAELEQAQDELEKMIRESPELQEVADSIRMDMTPEGLRIQLLDQDGRSMFQSGSSEMTDVAKDIMSKIATIIQNMPNQVSVRGHTDGVPYGAGATFTNWELSADRANSSRRFLLTTGLDEGRLNNVVGKADTDHLFPEDPFDARNRRISIILIRKELLRQEGANRNTQATLEEKPAPKLYERTPGAIEFP